MAKYRSKLPQLNGKIFLTDGGFETTLIFHEGVDLPHFATFPLLKDAKGRKAIHKYFANYIAIAKKAGAGFVLDTPTWRASADWGAKLGYSEADIVEANRASVHFMEQIRSEFQTAKTPIVLNGCIGPRGDGYDPGKIMTVDQAEAYHAAQVQALEEGGADMLTALTMTNVNEAIGITRAAQKAGLPCAISFTLETDGKLPTGQALKDAIQEVDAATGNGPAYYMINCAHPTHFEGVLSDGDWVERVRGLRANASKRSHKELDEAPDLDDGNPVELGGQYAELRRKHPQINVIGGCCGTDHRHVEQISVACKLAV